MDKEQFFDECQFAKVVTDADGHPCMLVGGIVLKVGGHLGAAYTEWLVSALRNSRPREAAEAAMASGMVGTAD